MPNLFNGKTPLQILNIEKCLKPQIGVAPRKDIKRVFQGQMHAQPVSKETFRQSDLWEQKMAGKNSLFPNRVL